MTGAATNNNPVVQSGRVLVSYGAHGIVETDEGKLLLCPYKRNTGRPLCGDYIEFSVINSEQANMRRILPRRNQFMRADRQQRPQPIAANLDQILIVIAAQPKPTKDLLDRYLLAAHSLNISPVIIHNKIDLYETDQREVTKKNLQRYTRLGYRVLETSCTEAQGLDELDPLCKDRTSILVGQSGVGKSSLANRLIPDREIQTGKLSSTTGKGTHTTTTTVLYRLAQGGALIDSPGVWEYGIWTMPVVEIAAGFIELQDYLENCRFNNCRHLSEPGCAVKAAVDQGQIDATRYAAYTRTVRLFADTSA